MDEGEDQASVGKMQTEVSVISRAGGSSDEFDEGEVHEG